MQVPLMLPHKYCCGLYAPISRLLVVTPYLHGTLYVCRRSFSRCASCCERLQAPVQLSFFQNRKVWILFRQRRLLRGPLTSLT